MAGEISVLGLILSSSQYMRSAKAWFPLGQSTELEHQLGPLVQTGILVLLFLVNNFVYKSYIVNSRVKSSEIKLSQMTTKY